MDDKLRMQETVIVEGRYDRVKLSEFIASPIIETGGFRVFKDKEKQELIRAVAQRRGILVMTDVDSAGFVIRNFLRGIVPQDSVLHAYIPTVKGKEKRKSQASKEGILGVEGIDRTSLIDSIRKSGAHIIEESQPLAEEDKSYQIDADKKDNVVEGLAPPAVDDMTTLSEASGITKMDFFDYGLTGFANSAKRREAVLSDLGLPKYLTTNAMITALNCLFTKEEFEKYIDTL